MKKKYIIKLEENEIAYKTVNSNGYPMIGLLHPVPYTEPDLEQVRKEAYKEGREAGIKDGKREAWEVARKISLAKIDGGFSWESMNNMFGTDSPSKIYKTFTASEAIEKIRQYEQEQEEFHVGDEVEMKCGVRPAIYMQGTKGSDEIYLLFNDGSCGVHSKSEIERKTGRHFPEIATILEKMRGEKDG